MRPPSTKVPRKPRKPQVKKDLAAVDPGWEQKKQVLREQAASGAPEPKDEDLQKAVAAQVAAKFAAMDAAPVLTAAPMTREPEPKQDVKAIDAEIRSSMPTVVERPVMQDPRVEQQQTLDALVREQKEAVKPVPPGQRPLPTRRKNETTQQYTERLVDVMVAAQMERRKLVLERRRLKQPIHDIPPIDVFMPTRRDAAAAPEGAKLNREWHQQWIPTKDIEGKPDPSLMKVQEMRDWDYQVVTDEAGKPCQGRLGVLMQGPPERRAARQTKLTPAGARRSQEDTFLQNIDDINREHGRRVLMAEDRSGKEQF